MLYKIGTLLQPVYINNSATAGSKDTSGLSDDNQIYINILSGLNPFKKYIENNGGYFIPANKSEEFQGIDLKFIYFENGIEQVIYIDVKTQVNINGFINIYAREILNTKNDNRIYVVFNNKG